MPRAAPPATAHPSIKESTKGGRRQRRRLPLWRWPKATSFMDGCAVAGGQQTWHKHASPAKNKQVRRKIWAQGPVGPAKGPKSYLYIYIYTLYIPYILPIDIYLLFTKQFGVGVGVFIFVLILAKGAGYGPRVRRAPKSLLEYSAMRNVIIPQTVLALRGSYGVGKDGAMICGRTRARLPRSSNHVNYNTKWTQPSKTHSKINI